VDVQIWRIWPAVLLHTVFAASESQNSMDLRARSADLLAVVIVVLQEKGGFKSLAIPNVMLTVLGARQSRVRLLVNSRQRAIGVVIGFVISYRASSGQVSLVYALDSCLKLFIAGMTGTGWGALAGQMLSRTHESVCLYFMWNRALSAVL